MNGGETLFDTVLQDQSVEGGSGDFFAALMCAVVLTHSIVDVQGVK